MSEEKQEPIHGKPIKCKDCAYQMNIEELEVGDDLECDECGCTMEITSMDPPKVKVIEEEK
jgi:lysine biosynthesis protein LysW